MTQKNEGLIKLVSDNDVTPEQVAALLTSEAFITAIGKYVFIGAGPDKALESFFNDDVVLYVFKYQNDDYHLTMNMLDRSHCKAHNIIKVNNSFFKIHINNDFELQITPVDLHLKMVAGGVQNSLTALQREDILNILVMSARSKFRESPEYKRIGKQGEFATLLDSLKNRRKINPIFLDSFVQSLDFCELISVHENYYLMRSDANELFKLHLAYQECTVVMIDMEPSQKLEYVQSGSKLKVCWDGENRRWVHASYAETM